ncbi:MAG: ester cyclase [Chloroflexi bacterium]|nr:ester cyclase [Chloroflexota bacterium]
MAIEDAIRKGLEAFNRHEVEGVAELYAPGATVYDPLYPQPLRGRESIKKDWQEFIKAFPDIRMTATHILATGDTAAVEAVLTGTHKGPLTGPTGTIPPTNRRVELRGSFFVRCDPQGQILEERRYFDTASMMAQLGMKLAA